MAQLVRDEQVVEDILIRLALADTARATASALISPVTAGQAYRTSRPVGWS